MSCWRYGSQTTPQKLLLSHDVSFGKKRPGCQYSRKIARVIPSMALGSGPTQSRILKWDSLLWCLLSDLLPLSHPCPGPLWAPCSLAPLTTCMRGLCLLPFLNFLPVQVTFSATGDIRGQQTSGLAVLPQALDCLSHRSLSLGLRYF